MSLSPDIAKERPRDRRRRARIESILDASMVLFYEEGIEALTMRRLADALDLTPGALYRYFPGKDEILLGLGNRALQQISDAMDVCSSHCHVVS